MKLVRSTTPSLPTATVLGKLSQFGGFWADNQNALEELEENSRFPDRPDLKSYFSDWIRNGFVKFENAVPNNLVDKINDDVARAWQGEFPSLFCEQDGVKRIKPHMRDQRVKLLDLYTVSESTRNALFCPAIVEFLTHLFEFPPMVFQSLYFEYGSTQSMHQDSAYVKVSSPTKFVGVWIALEDIQPDSGELEYYEGSHRIAETIWEEKYKNMPYPELFKSSHQEFLDSLHRKSQDLNLQRVTHRPKKGDVLIWHSDLVHGGCKKVNPALTRKSLAVHYCPSDVTPHYFRTNGGTGPIPHSSNGFVSFENHRVDPPSLGLKIRRKIVELLRE